MTTKWLLEMKLRDEAISKLNMYRDLSKRSKAARAEERAAEKPTWLLAKMCFDLNGEYRSSVIGTAAYNELEKRHAKMSEKEWEHIITMSRSLDFADNPPGGLEPYERHRGWFEPTVERPEFK